MEVTHIIWTILAGIAVASGVLWYNRRFLGAFVHRLIEIDATSPETAVTIEELHLTQSAPLKNALREDGSLHDAILSTADEPPRYYIAQKKLPMLKAKYRKENASIFSVILIICLLIVTGVLFTVLYPIVSDFAQSLLNK
ncbi:MAG: hypothetical protein IJD82_05950 [Clostridia bacterium]|nr:hypothetical protein [Clostridia bacterium]